jgi:hypothetical protein
MSRFSYPYLYTVSECVPLYLRRIQLDLVVFQKELPVLHTDPCFSGSIQNLFPPPSIGKLLVVLVVIVCPVKNNHAAFLQKIQSVQKLAIVHFCLADCDINLFKTGIRFPADRLNFLCYLCLYNAFSNYKITTFRATVLWSLIFFQKKGKRFFNRSVVIINYFYNKIFQIKIQFFD